MRTKWQIKQQFDGEKNTLKNRKRISINLIKMDGMTFKNSKMRSSCGVSCQWSIRATDMSLEIVNSNKITYSTEILIWLTPTLSLTKDNKMFELYVVRRSNICTPPLVIIKLDVIYTIVRGCGNILHNSNKILKQNQRLKLNNIRIKCMNLISEEFDWTDWSVLVK